MEEDRVEDKQVPEAGENEEKTEKTAEPKADIVADAVRRAKDLLRRRRPQVAAVLLFLFVALLFRSWYVPRRIEGEALRAFDAGDYVAAVAAYRSLLERNEARHDAYAPMGRALEELGADEDAAEAYSLYLTKYPNDDAMLLRMGNLLLRMKRHEDARIYLERAAVRMPEQPDVLYALAEAYDAVGEAEKAKDLYADYLDKAPEDPEKLILASRALFRKGEYEKALAGFSSADVLLPSDDRRAYHGMNAARDMLGWPTDAGMTVTPGDAIGDLRLHASSEEVAAAWGEPAKRAVEGEYEVWGYGEGSEALEVFVYFENGSVIEIATRARRHRTSDGLGVSNFMEPKHAERFRRWEDASTQPPTYRYILRDGGLAFYSGEQPIAIIFDGDFPLSEATGHVWVRADGEEERIAPYGVASLSGSRGDETTFAVSGDGDTSFDARPDQVSSGAASADASSASGDALSGQPASADR